MKPENVFQIGSMTKQFTAVAILILMEEGKLNLKDDLTKFIPDYPTPGNKVTVHHLLTHTSGIKDFTQVNALRELARNDLEPIEIIEMFKNEPLNFYPGEEFRYSNSGYILLGYIIEKLSGISYERFVEDRIFRVAGMKDSRYASDREIIRNRAYGYQNRNGLYNKTFISLNIPYASGALMSTVDDMLNWQIALNQNLLVNKKTLKKAFLTYKLNDGTSLNYGYGWHLKEIEDSPTREHGGSIFGFKSMGVYIPERDIYVIGLSNCDCNSPTRVVRDIASWALKYL
jgi:CubicO group peptidase (beta-lactamase class C family)